MTLNVDSHSALQSRYGVIFLISIFTFFLLLIAGTDGWFRVSPVRSDNAWFFMCGKSWMEGLVPYKDFTDSKGPLLWLVYGLAYLISPHNLYGVFLFQLISYSLTFFVVYLIARLYLDKSAPSLLAAFCLAFFYFYPGMHYQMRIEDFCHLFQAVTFYILLKTVFFRNFKQKYFLILGGMCGSILMIKYSYFITTLIPTGMIFIFLLVNRVPSIRFIILFSAGMAVTVLPFILYFLRVGAFDDFIQEYFFNTSQTIINIKNQFDTMGTNTRWPYKIWYLYRGMGFWGEFMRFSLLGLLMTMYLYRKKSYFVLTLLFWYAGSVCLFSVVDGEGYYLTLCIFMIGGFILPISLLKGIDYTSVTFWSGVILGIIALSTTFYYASEFHFAKENILANRRIGEASRIIKETGDSLGRNPTITYLHTNDRGEHIGSNAVAGTKYWAEQAGMTNEMRFRHKNDIYEYRPDFVIVEEGDDDATFQKDTSRLETSGYEKVIAYYPYFPPDGKQDKVRLLYRLIQH